LTNLQVSGKDNNEIVTMVLFQQKKGVYMTFEETIKQNGFGKAVVEFQERLAPDFWDGLRFEQLVEIYCACDTNDSLSQRAFNTLAEMPIDFDNWRIIYRRAPQKSDLRALALMKMAELASSLNDWKIIKRIAPEGSTLKATAHDKIVEGYKLLNFD